MVGWPITGMTGLTICSLNRLVIEIYLVPIRGIVAQRALSLIVVRRFIIRVAGLAISGIHSLVIEISLFPVNRIVAG